MKKLSIIAACVALIGLLGGCGSNFDASGYVKALLDNSYKNDSTQFVSMKIGTADEASKLYEEGLDSEVSAMVSSMGYSVSDEQEQAIREVFAKILAGAKYTVGEAEKQDDGSYVVTVTYEQMEIFGPAIDDYMDEIMEMQAGLTGEETNDELVAMAIDAFKDVLDETLANVSYADPETTTITVELIDKVYTPDQNDLYDLEASLFDIDSVY
ncbi:MAG: hypothetical protein HDR03_11510 [Lachnospiraceae bacterium]|nr:hypothetical protein [Lachnospiraceae bacterium]